jgi:hypothetical protein
LQVIISTTFDPADGAAPAFGISESKNLNRPPFPDWNLQQYRNVLAHLGDHGWRSLGMEFRAAARICPVARI